METDSVPPRDTTLNGSTRALERYTLKVLPLLRPMVSAVLSNRSSSHAGTGRKLCSAMRTWSGFFATKLSCLLRRLILSADGTWMYGRFCSWSGTVVLVSVSG